MAHITQGFGARGIAPPVSRLHRLSNRFTDRVRHPAAWNVTKAPAAEGSFDALEGHKYCLLVSYRRSGEPVPTPVWFALANGSLYVRTEPGAKVERIRRNPRVRVAPCNSRGKPLGPATEARARILPPGDEETAETALTRAYGLGRRLYTRMSLGRTELVYLEISTSTG